MTRDGEIVAHMAEMKNPYSILVGNKKGTNHLGDLSVDGRILKWIFKEQGVMM
jgi:hypothetical protein